MNPLTKKKVLKHRETLKTTDPIPKEASVELPVTAPKEELRNQYDSSGSDKQGYKTEPSPNALFSIDFKPRNSDPFNFKYAYFHTHYFEDEKSSIILQFSLGDVKVSGSNLDDLYDHLGQNKVKQIYVTDKTNERDDRTIIDSITVKRHREVEL